MILRPAGRFLTMPLPPAPLAARFFAAAILPPLLFLAIEDFFSFVSPMQVSCACPCVPAVALAGAVPSDALPSWAREPQLRVASPQTRKRLELNNRRLSILAGARTAGTARGGRKAIRACCHPCKVHGARGSFVQVAIALAGAQRAPTTSGITSTSGCCIA
jgi:hypothetical protein